MYRNILVPVENSPFDQAILNHIQPLAKACGAKLLLVHVADGFVARNQEQLNLADSEEIQADRAYLEQLKSELSVDGFDVSIELARGEPAPQILALAEERGCDLIAMATHGHKLLGDVLLGSVAEKIRHRTDIPVLMLRAKKAD